MATSAVYGGIRVIARGAGRLSDGSRNGATSVPTHRSDAVQAFANAVWGDELTRRGSSMSIGMAVRDRSGAAVSLDQASLAEAFPGASGRLVVLVHGLGQTERCFYSSNGTAGLAETLSSSGLTPVAIRYNTGHPVADNGDALARLLDELFECWPVRPTEIVLVGYSMGGLVARAAIASGRAGETGWIDAARHVVSIAAPHLGSPIEKAVEVAARSLMVVPQTRPLSEFLAQRSAGIRDLRSGATRSVVSDGIEHHLIGAVITESATHPVGSVVGDLIVRPASSIAPELVARNRRLIGGRRHFDILSEPAVGRCILEWID
jgi:pimeloyl-ACP methyl ester carboxylesterase